MSFRFRVAMLLFRLEQPLIQFFTDYGHIGGSLDSEPYPTSGNTHDRYRNLVTDQDSLANLAT